MNDHSHVQRYNINNDNVQFIKDKLKNKVKEWKQKNWKNK